MVIELTSLNSIQFVLCKRILLNRFCCPLYFASEMIKFVYMYLLSYLSRKNTFMEYIISLF